MKKLVLFLVLILFSHLFFPHTIEAQVAACNLTINPSNGPQSTTFVVQVTGCPRDNLFFLIVRQGSQTITYTMSTNSSGSGGASFSGSTLSGTYSIAMYANDGTTQISNSTSFTVFAPTSTPTPAPSQTCQSITGAQCLPSNCPMPGCEVAAPPNGFLSCQPPQHCCLTTGLCAPDCSPGGFCVTSPANCPAGGTLVSSIQCSALGTGSQCCRVSPVTYPPPSGTDPVVPQSNVAAPVPPPYYACNMTAGITDNGSVFTTLNEYHSLRPYQASPCKKGANNLSENCANDLIGESDVTVTMAEALSCDPTVPCARGPEGCRTCYFNIPLTKKVIMVYPNAQLPILGNTQLVPNSQSEALGNTSFIDDAERVNSYVSWYLNGTGWRAEETFLNPVYPPNPSHPQEVADVHKVIDYSGPLRKLLPWTVQAIQRIDTIDQAVQSNDIRHDQIVACTAGAEVPVIGIGVDLGIPAPCYNKQGILDTIFGSRVDKRLSKWRNALTDWVPPLNLIGLHWVHAIPPLEHDFNSFTDYWLAYREWRGEVCSANTPIGSTGLSIYLCGRIPVIGGDIKPQFWSAFFSYIPFTSTEDRVGKVYVRPGLQAPPAGYTIQDPGWNVVPETITFLPTQEGAYRNRYSDDLFFPHTLESLKLGKLLQTTFVPKYANSNSGVDTSVPNGSDSDSGSASNVFWNTYRCDQKNVRWNPGDQLFAHSSADAPFSEWAEYNPIFQSGRNLSRNEVSGDLHFNVVFSCELRNEFIDTNCEDNCNNSCTTPPAPYTDCGDYCQDHCLRQDHCTRTYRVAMSSWNQTPVIDDIWETLVNGNDSIYKRMMPGGILHSQEILDLPGVTSAGYYTAFDRTWAGELGSNRPGSSAEMFIPHLGGIQEYFLNQIQELLRPQGFGPHTSTDEWMPRPNDVGEDCEWTGFGCNYYSCQCTDWNAVDSICVSGVWLDGQGNSCGSGQNPPIACGPTSAPICESGRCNPYELRQRSDYENNPNISCNPWPFSGNGYDGDDCTNLTFNGVTVCDAVKYSHNTGGGWGPCHFMNENVCIRTDITPNPNTNPRNCSAVCNSVCCAYGSH